MAGVIKMTCFRYYHFYLLLTFCAGFILHLVFWRFNGENAEGAESIHTNVETHSTHISRMNFDEISANRRLKKTNPTEDEVHALPGRFNLLEDAAPYSNALVRPSKDCSLEYMNSMKLQQDHPCVINYIRKKYLHPPAPLQTPLQLDYPEIIDPSDGQSKIILEILNNKTNGFFIECGALDGENLSNTMYMERFLNWTGILIEADQDSFQNILMKKRKSWALPVCLSVYPYPQEVTFRASYALGQIIDSQIPLKNLSGRTGSYGKNLTIQCFPIYSILLATGRTHIDYFSLDVEGHELAVLKTIPFHKVRIETLSVEWAGAVGGEERKWKMKAYLSEYGYKYQIDDAGDVIFVHDVENP